MILRFGGICCFAACVAFWWVCIVGLDACVPATFTICGFVVSVAWLDGLLFRVRLRFVFDDLMGGVTWFWMGWFDCGCWCVGLQFVGVVLWFVSGFLLGCVCGLEVSWQV